MHVYSLQGTSQHTLSSAPPIAAAFALRAQPEVVHACSLHGVLQQEVSSAPSIAAASGFSTQPEVVHLWSLQSGGGGVGPCAHCGPPLLLSQFSWHPLSLFWGQVLWQASTHNPIISKSESGGGGGDHGQLLASQFSWHLVTETVACWPKTSELAQVYKTCWNAID